MKSNRELMRARYLRTVFAALCVAFGARTSFGQGDPVSCNGGPAKVEVRKNGERFQIYVGDKPFYIKGAGIELGSPEKLKEHGGNCFRTWSTDNGRDTAKEILDRTGDTSPNSANRAS